jgi:hypothetical protein
MDLLPLLLILLGFLVFSVGSLWFTVNAFRVSVLWGIVVFLFTPAWIRFAWCHWDMAKRPFIVSLIGAAILFGGFQMPTANATGPTAELAQPFGGDKADKEPKKGPKLPPMFAAQKEMQLKLKLTALAERENDLRARKAAIDPRDQQAVALLKEEIINYNAELQPALLEMKERGIQSAAR